MSTPFRTYWARLLTGVVFLSCLCAFAALVSGSLSAQQPKKAPIQKKKGGPQTKKDAPVEEPEEPGKAQKRKVIRVDDDEAPKASRKSKTPDSVTGDLATLMKESKHSGIVELCQKLVTAHDVIGAQYSGGHKENLTVVPLAKYYGAEPKPDR